MELDLGEIKREDNREIKESLSEEEDDEDEEDEVVGLEEAGQLARDRSFEEMSINVRRSIQIQADEVQSHQDIHSIKDLMRLS